MWPEHARGVRRRWRGFADCLGDRFVAESTNGLRSEGLVLPLELTREETSLSILRALEDLSRASHPSLRIPREVRRLAGHGGRPVLVSDYHAGQRLSTWLASRGGAPVSTGTVLYIARETAAALMAVASSAPQAFHGTVGLERIVLGTNGRVVLVEPGLAGLFSGHQERTPADWWRHYRLAVPFSSRAEPFGQASDACQLALVVLQLLLGRPLGDAEYPDGLAVLLGEVQETDLLGERAPLGSGLFEWLTLAFGIDPASESPTIPTVCSAFDALLSDEGGYVAVPLGLDVEPEKLEALDLEDGPEPSRAGAAPAQYAWRERVPDLSAPPVPLASDQRTWDAPLQVLADADGPPCARARDDLTICVDDAPAGWRGGEPGRTSTVFTGRRPARSSVPEPPARRAWRAGVLRWGLAAVVATLMTAVAGATWLNWRDRHIEQQTGSLDIRSDPPGAALLVDGLERGKTPLTLAVLPGRHEIVVKSALGSGRSIVDVRTGARQTIVVPLELGTDPGHIDISTEPPGAEIVLDGVSHGRAPKALTDLAPGEHSLRVSSGTAHLERRLTLAPGERLTVFVPLAGWVDVRARVPLEVLDRETRVGTSEAGRLMVAAGRRRLRFVNNTFGIDTTQEVVVRAGQVTQLAVPLPAGVLSVASDPTADVWVDGEPYGRTPTGNRSVSVGQHEVLLRHPRWGEQRITVIVGLGAPTRLSINLRK